MPQQSKPGVNWDAIRQRYEAGETPREIWRTDVGVTRQAIEARVKKHGWRQTEAARKIAEHQQMVRQQAATLANSPYAPVPVQACWGKDTPETRAHILHNLERGATFDLAVKAAGLSRMTLHRWRETDPEFANQIEAARSGHAITHIGVIDYAGRETKDWKASAHLLSKNPLTKADYGDTAKAGGPTIQVVLNVTRGTATATVGPVIDAETITIEAGDD